MYIVCKNQRLTSHWSTIWSFRLTHRRCIMSCADWLDYRLRQLLHRSIGCLRAVSDGMISDQLRHTRFNSYVTNLGRPIKLFCHYAFSSLGTPWHQGSSKPSLRSTAFSVPFHTFPQCLTAACVCVCVCVCVCGNWCRCSSNVRTQMAVLCSWRCHLKANTDIREIFLGGNG
jgi:hypothetical protein